MQQRIESTPTSCEDESVLSNLHLTVIKSPNDIDVFYYGVHNQSLGNLEISYYERFVSDLRHDYSPNAIKYGIIIAGERTNGALRVNALAFANAQRVDVCPKSIFPKFQYKRTPSIYQLSYVTPIEDITHLIDDSDNLPRELIFKYLTV
jgi:hypothetical protein